MNVDHILNQTLSFVTPKMHKVRRNSLKCLITSLIRGADLSVTNLGRNILSETSEKHQIKRSDILCSNVHLHAEIPSIYETLTRKLVGTQKHPVILVDWSDLDARQENFLIRAAIAVNGRSLTLYEEVHPQSSKEKPKVHKDFMMVLKNMLPSTCRPIIVTDAGFRTPWFNMIQSLNWDYVGRMRNRTFCKQDKDWLPVKALYKLATTRPKSLGRFDVARCNPITCNFVIFKSRNKGRKDLVAKGNRRRRSGKSKANAKREREPWLLTTSLCSKQLGFAKKVVKIYTTRMQIEESFRDVKTGLNMNVCNSRKRLRILVLLVIALIAQYILMLIGMALVIQGKNRQYQANSVKSRAVLSYQFIALRAVRNLRFCIEKEEWKSAIKQLNKFMLEPLNV
ncbi:IS4 family transposase [Thalassotalea crassostreae]|uniref:IS4 family transposase n=1 Tax=Thalassotalea crassostreae TaxID=1763536 RepID=UPI0008A652A8|nr:IS4 family transposase [Thalassotalea crassostreae]